MQAAGKLNDDACMPAGIRKEALLGRPKMIEQLGSHLIANERHGLPLEQTTDRRLQYIAKIILRYIGSNHFVERFPVSQRCLYRLLERVMNEPLAAQHQKGAMPEIVIGGPPQNSHRPFVWNQ